MLDPTEAALLDELALDPDGAARDVLADHWLGGAAPERGQLLRLRPPSPHLERLLADHAAIWTRPLRDAGFAEDLLDLRRGFLEHPILLPDPDLLDGDLFRISPAIYLERACIRSGLSPVYDARRRTPAGERGRFAIKVPVDGEDQPLVDREHGILRSIDHPNVVRVVGRAIRIGVVGNVLRWAGRSLPEAFRGARGGVGEACALSIGIQVCDALEAIHAAGIVHEAIVPRRLLISDDGTVTLAAFTYARAEGWGPPPNELRSRRARINPSIPMSALSPERLREEDYDHRIDLFSLAYVLSHLICGRPPVRFDISPEALDAIRDGDFDLSGCSPPVEPILRRALAPEASRHGSAAELRDDLVRAARLLELELGPAAILAALPAAAPDPDA